jgi:hypothetical protein
MRTLLAAVVLLATPAVHAQTPAFQRGDLVRVQTAEGTPASPELQIVIALPGDRLRVDDSGVFVNDAEVRWMSSELKRGLPHQSEVIQPGQVLVAGEEHHTIMSAGGSRSTTVGRSWSNIPLTRLSKANP